MGKDTPFLYFSLAYFTGKRTYRHCIQPAIKLRQGIWNQLYNLDAEYRQFDKTLVAVVG